MKKKNLKNGFDFKNATVHKGPLLDPKATKVQTSIRIDGDVMLWLQKTAHEQSIPYQTFINKLLREAMQKPSLEKRVEELEKKFDKQKRLFEQNLFHPGLETELLEPRHMRIWSFRVDRKYRAIFIFRESDIVELIDVNNHYQ